MNAFRPDLLGPIFLSLQIEFHSIGTLERTENKFLLLDSENSVASSAHERQFPVCWSAGDVQQLQTTTDAEILRPLIGLQIRNKMFYLQ